MDFETHRCDTRVCFVVVCAFSTYVVESVGGGPPCDGSNASSSLFTQILLSAEFLTLNQMPQQRQERQAI